MSTLVKNDRVNFDELTHTYLMGDTFLTGVTTLMKKHGLSPDYGGIPKDVLKKAADRGTAIHKLLESHDNGFANEETAELKAYKALKLPVIASEYLVSDNRIVASSIDKIIKTEHDNIVDLGDVKTTYTLHRKALSWQLSIYAYLFELQNPAMLVRNLYGIHVRDGKATLVQVNRISSDAVKELLSCEAEGRKFNAEKWEGMTTTDLTKVFGKKQIKKLMSAENKLLLLSDAVKKAQEAIAQQREQIYAFMAENNLTELICDSGKYKLRRESVREGLDTTKIKADRPDIFAKYKKISQVKGSVSFEPNV